MKRPNIEDYKNIPEGSSIWVSYSGSEYDEDVEKYIDYLESRTKLKNNGDLGDVSVCSCFWKKRVENLMKGLEAQHIEEWMREADDNDYLLYGVAYKQEVNKLLNKR